MPRVLHGCSVEFVEERFHFTKRMPVAGPLRAQDPLFEHRLRLAGAACLDECLSSHKICSRVIGMAGEQLGELRDRRVDLPLVRIFHRQSVVGKDIGWILRQDLFECRDFVHDYRASR